jgi:anti-anti-sigma factor
MATNERPLVSSEYVGEIVILRIETENLLLDDSACRFYDEVVQAIGARARIVLDMAQVRNLGSMAFGRLVTLWGNSRRKGGMIVLCRPTAVIREAFRVNQLDRVFQIVSSLEEAFAALSWCLAIECPVAGCEGDALCHDPSIAQRGGELCCRSCGCRFRVAPFQLSTSGEAQVTVGHFEIPTYEHEQVRAELGALIVLQIVGRLDLFTLEALVDAWRSLPPPRRAVVDLRAATELSDASLRLLEKHLRNGRSADRFVVLVDPSRSDRTCGVLTDVLVTSTRDEALSVLSGSARSLESPASLFVSARAVGRTAEQTQSRDAATRAGDPGPSSLIP